MSSPRVVAEVEVLVEFGAVLEEAAHEFRQGLLLPLGLQVLVHHAVPLHHVLDTGGAQRSAGCQKAHWNTQGNNMTAQKPTENTHGNNMAAKKPTENTHGNNMTA